MQQAQQFASQIPQEEAMNLFQPLMDVIVPVIGIASAIVGGIFGLYLIMLIIRAYYERKRYLVLKDIRYDLDYLNQHFGLPYSQKKPHHLYRKIIPLEELKKLEREHEKKGCEEDEKEERKEERKRKS